MSSLAKSQSLGLTPGERELQRQDVKAAVRVLLESPEFVLSSVLIALWCLALVHDGPALVVIIGWLALFGFGELFLYVAIKEGSQGFLNAVAVYLGSIGVFAIAAYGWSYAVGLTLVGTSILMLLDFGRMSFARRRAAKLHPEVAVTAALSTLLSGTAAGLSAAVMSFVSTDSDGRSWAFVPISSLVLAVVFGASILLLRRSSARGNGEHWAPGETMLPPPSV